MGAANAFVPSRVEVDVDGPLPLMLCWVGLAWAPSMWCRAAAAFSSRYLIAPSLVAGHERESGLSWNPVVLRRRRSSRCASYSGCSAASLGACFAAARVVRRRLRLARWRHARVGRARTGRGRRRAGGGRRRRHGGRAEALGRLGCWTSTGSVTRWLDGRGALASGTTVPEPSWLTGRKFSWAVWPICSATSLRLLPGMETTTVALAPCPAS